MKYTTIFEKLLSIFEIISTSWVSIVALGLVLGLGVLLIAKKISKKNCFLLCLTVCVSFLGVIIEQNYNAVSKIMNQIIDKLFVGIYFPSIYVYLFIFIVISVVAIFQLLNAKTPKSIKGVHGISLVVMNFVLVLILEIVAKNDIDLFSKKSLFTNTNLVTLMEFSVNVFIVWVISLLVINLVNIITEFILNKKFIKQEVNMSGLDCALEAVVSEDMLKENYIDSNKKEESLSYREEVIPNSNVNYFIPNFINLESVPPYEEQVSSIRSINNINQSNTKYTTENPDVVSLEDTKFDLSSFIPKANEMKPIQPLNQTNEFNHNEVFEQILRNELPYVKNEPVKTKVDLQLEAEKNTYTLNDYKIFNKMLKDIKEHNQSNSVSIDKNLEYRLITKYSYDNYNMFKKMLKIYSN